MIKSGSMILTQKYLRMEERRVRRAWEILQSKLAEILPAPVSAAHF